MADGAGQPVDVPAEHRPSRLRVLTRRGGKTVLTLLSVTVLALTGYGWQVIGNVNAGVTTTDVFDDEPRAIPLDGAVDILLVGQDSRTDAQGNPLPQEVLDKLHAGEEKGDKQTDTMILVHIPQDGRRAVAISFPRDSFVEIADGYGTHKLNSAFVYAYNDTFSTLRQSGETDLGLIEEEAKVAGRKNLIATIENLIGQPGMIDRYAEVNLASFYEVTKALGGIEVCLNHPVREEKSGVNLPAGRQEIEGVQALAFVRQRYGLTNGDLDRIARQQAFLSGLARKVLSSEVLTSPSKIQEVVKAVQKSVVLSKDWDLLEFAMQMRNLTGGNIEFHTIPVAGDARIGGAAVLQIDVPEVRAFVQGLVSDAPPGRIGTGSGPVDGAGEFTVDVYADSAENGTRLRQLLRDAGFQGEGYASTMNTPVETVVYYPPGGQAGVEAVRQALGRNVSTEADDTLPSGTLRVVLGGDAALPSMGTAAGRDRLVGAARQNLLQGPAPHTAQPEHAQGSESDPPITAGGVPCVN